MIRGALGTSRIFQKLGTPSSCVADGRRQFWGWLNSVFNRVDESRIKDVGPDRAAAEWLLRCGAAVKWDKGPDDFVRDYNSLPVGQFRDLHISEVDATDSAVMHIGFMHFRGLKALRKAVFHRCGYMEDDAVKALGYLKHTLKDLQISSCGNVTDEGILSLVQMKELERLYLFDFLEVRDRKNCIHVLQKKLPNCKIIFPYAREEDKDPTCFRRDTNLEALAQMAKPVYIYDDKLAAATDCIPHLRHRSRMVHDLIKAYGLLDSLDVRASKPAQIEDLLTFHSSAYLEYLKTNSSSPTGTTNNDDVNRSADEDDFADPPNSEEEEFGLGYDCPTFPNMLQFALTITGGTMQAVKAIVEEGAKIAINWQGGWHHGQRNEASGFCYINDIVIGISQLLKHFSRVLYVDLDCHHGDGVENAFSYSNKVMTMSLHHYEVGYFPGTGTMEDCGFGRGKYYAVNVPLKSGVNDEDYIYIFDKAFDAIQLVFDADCIVVQCGSDCLAGDPLGSFNLTEQSLIHCVRRILKTDLPTVLLGGGGYDLANTAKAWTALTFEVLKKEAPHDIPDHDFFLRYGPDFVLQVSRGLRKNENSSEYLENIIASTSSIKDNLERSKTKKLKIEER